VVLMGHDHARECKKVMNVAGDSVLVMDPARERGGKFRASNKKRTTPSVLGLQITI